MLPLVAHCMSQPLSHIKMKISVKKYHLILIVAILILSCQSNEKFDSNKWKSKSIADFEITDIRERMLHDLVDSQILIGKSKSEIIYLLGQPEISNSNIMTYLVREKYGSNIDPIYIKYLEVNFDETGKANKQNILTKNEN